MELKRCIKTTLSSVFLLHVSLAMVVVKVGAVEVAAMTNSLEFFATEESRSTLSCGDTSGRNVLPWTTKLPLLPPRLSLVLLLCLNVSSTTMLLTKELDMTFSEELLPTQGSGLSLPMSFLSASPSLVSLLVGLALFEASELFT